MGFLLLVPFLLIRVGLLSRLSKDAGKRAAYFAPLLEREKTAYWVYQLSNGAIFLAIVCLNIKVEPPAALYAGVAFYAAGTLLLTLSVVHFAAPTENGLHQNGLYRFSRNPMYVSYFIFFVGCALLTQSWLLFVLVLVFQASAHWIILSEERWCTARFGASYLAYMRKVGRYF